MGWNNPAMKWSELERRLSGLPGADDDGLGREATLVAGPALAAPLTALLVDAGAGSI